MVWVSCALFEFLGCLHNRMGKKRLGSLPQPPSLHLLLILLYWRTSSCWWKLLVAPYLHPTLFHYCSHEMIVTRRGKERGERWGEERKGVEKREWSTLLTLVCVIICTASLQPTVSVYMYTHLHSHPSHQPQEWNWLRNMFNHYKKITRTKKSSLSVLPSNTWDNWNGSCEAIEI